MAELVALKYCAFISYSHVDASWAKWLHRGLETFRIDKDLVDRETAMGAIPRTLRPIFREPRRLHRRPYVDRAGARRARRLARADRDLLAIIGQEPLRH